MTKRVLIACMPKSGSTYLAVLIGALPGFSIKSYVPAYGRREQELCDAEIARWSSSGDQVAQHHVRASDYSLGLIEKYTIVPIVLVRNIYDCALSFAEHIVSESPICPMAYFDDSIASLPIRERLAAVVDLAAPWYINFYVSWWRSSRQSIITYEELVAPGPAPIADHLAMLGIAATRSDVIKAHDNAMSGQVRFNVGEPGRGKALVERAQQHQVARLASYYPDVDFSPIGISADRDPRPLNLDASNDSQKSLGAVFRRLWRAK